MIPCMLPSTVTNAALDELVAYRRIKDRAHNVCKQCMDESRRERKRCVRCGSIYDEDHGRLVQGGDEMEQALKELEASGAVKRQAKNA